MPTCFCHSIKLRKQYPLRRRALAANVRRQVAALREAEEAERDSMPSYGQTVRCALRDTLCSGSARPSGGRTAWDSMFIYGQIVRCAL